MTKVFLFTIPICSGLQITPDPKEYRTLHTLPSVCEVEEAVRLREAVLHIVTYCTRDDVDEVISVRFSGTPIERKLCGDMDYFERLHLSEPLKFVQAKTNLEESYAKVEVEVSYHLLCYSSLTAPTTQ